VAKEEGRGGGDLAEVEEGRGDGGGRQRRRRAAVAEEGGGGGSDRQRKEKCEGKCEGLKETLGGRTIL
jgi:hypothetical protein